MMLLPILMLLAGGQSGGDPLAPARAGKVQCYSPNVEKRTCGAIAAYTLRPDGKWDNKARVLVAPVPVVVLEAVTVVDVEGEAICGPLARKDLEAASVSADGVAMPHEDARIVIEQVAAAFAGMGMLDVRSCTIYRPDGDGLRTEDTIDGKPRPDLKQHVIWIDADEAYSLGMP